MKCGRGRREKACDACDAHILTQTWTGGKQMRGSAGANAADGEMTHSGGEETRMRGISRVFSVLLTLLRMAYVAVTIVAFCSTGETLWTVDFCLTALALASVGNGMSTRETTLVLLVGHVILLPCVLERQRASACQRYIDMINQALLSILAYYTIRIETAGHLSTWIGVRWPVCVCVCARAPSPTLSPTDPVPRGLLTLCPAAY